MLYSQPVSLINKRVFLHILILICSLILCGSVYPDGGTRDKVEVVVLDAGHGGKDPGALGGNSQEKDIALSIILKLGNYIEENHKDVKVIYTRDKDVFIPLHKRADIANQNNADLFISVHANWWKVASVSGAETFVMGSSKNEDNLQVAMLENSVITLEEDYTTNYEGFDPNSAESYIMFNYMQYTYLNQSVHLASFIQDQFRERVKRRDRGVKQERFIVLWRTTMPSVLVEAGFISNAAEEKYLMSENGQTYMASAIYRAFRDYKTSIENKSNFDTEIIQTQAVEDKSETVAGPSVFFMVQITTSNRSIPLDSELFSGLESVSEFKTESYYKYATGQAVTYSEAAELRKKIQQRFKDAFIIAVRSGEIISLKEAIKN